MNNISVDCTIFMTIPWTIYVIIKTEKAKVERGKSTFLFSLKKNKWTTNKRKSTVLKTHTHAYTTFNENHHLHKEKGLQHVE